MYRIATEDKNREQVEELINARFEAFTLYNAKGYWRGVAEQSLIIDVEFATQEQATELAQAIKVLNRQECVLVQYLPTTALLV